MGRPLNRSEGATLSKRVSTLIGYGLLSRWGRDLELTEDGRDRLYEYARKNSSELDMDVVLFELDLEEDVATLGIWSKLKKAFARFVDEGDLSREEQEKAIEAVWPLYDAAFKRVQEKADLLRAIDEAEKSRKPIL